MCNESCMIAVENCKDNLADWSRKTPIKQQIKFGLLFALLVTCVLSVILLFCHYMFWKERPRYEGERFMRCNPSGYTSEMYAPESKRIYEFDEFLQTKRVRANRDRLDESAWRSVYDAIRYVQDLDDDTQQGKIMKELMLANNKKGKSGQPTMDYPKYRWKIVDTTKYEAKGVKVGFNVADILERHYEFDCNSGHKIPSLSLLVLSCFITLMKIIF